MREYSTSWPEREKSTKKALAKPKRTNVNLEKGRVAVCQRRCVNERRCVNGGGAVRRPSGGRGVGASCAREGGCAAVQRLIRTRGLQTARRPNLGPISAHSHASEARNVLEHASDGDEERSQRPCERGVLQGAERQSDLKQTRNGLKDSVGARRPTRISAENSTRISAENSTRISAENSTRISAENSAAREEVERR
eukprot:scaffold5589_cov115-Isochrysis_galbana.AAC.2